MAHFRRWKGVVLHTLVLVILSPFYLAFVVPTWCLEMFYQTLEELGKAWRGERPGKPGNFRESLGLNYEVEEHDQGIVDQADPYGRSIISDYRAVDAQREENLRVRNKLTELREEEKESWRKLEKALSEGPRDWETS